MSRQVLHVSLDGSAHGPGTKEHPFRSIQDALEDAEPGDTIRVAPGDYRERIVTVRSGKPGAPISLVGSPGTRISGAGSGRQIEILDDYVTLVWVEGASHVRIEHNRLEDGGGECIRIKYLSTEVVVAHNTIDRCGLTGFDLGDDEHNGEGVYIGTDPYQLDRNPTDVPDASNDNVVRDNTIATHGAECVDIKEGAEHNRVLDNVCSHSRDPDGAGLDSRGNHNVFRGNVVRAGSGAGIRFGGYGSRDGIENAAVDNVFVGNRGYGVLVLRRPQGPICGNVVRRNGLGATSTVGVRPAAPCR
jgi:nitrous oxidase accessory protein NosD